MKKKFGGSNFSVPMPNRPVPGMTDRFIPGMPNRPLSNMPNIRRPDIQNIRRPDIQNMLRSNDPIITRPGYSRSGVDIEAQVPNKDADSYKIGDELMDFFLDKNETIIILLVLVTLTMVKIVLSIQDKVSFMIVLKDIIMAVCVFIIYRCSKKEMDCGVFPLLLLAIFFIYLIHYIVSHFIHKNKKKEEKKK